MIIINLYILFLVIAKNDLFLFQDLFENIENINPGQQAKWIKEQKQLQRSFLNRINRVHHYQTSPKHPRRKDRRLKHSGISNHNY